MHPQYAALRTDALPVHRALLSRYDYSGSGSGWGSFRPAFSDGWSSAPSLSSAAKTIWWATERARGSSRRQQISVSGGLVPQRNGDPACVNYDALDMPKKGIAITELFNSAQHLLYGLADEGLDIRRPHAGQNAPLASSSGLRRGYSQPRLRAAN